MRGGGPTGFLWVPFRAKDLLRGEGGPSTCFFSGRCFSEGFVCLLLPLEVAFGNLGDRNSEIKSMCPWYHRMGKDFVNEALHLGAAVNPSLENFRLSKSIPSRGGRFFVSSQCLAESESA